MVFIDNVGRRVRTNRGEFSRFVEFGDASLNGREHNALMRHPGAAPWVFEDVAYATGADRIEDARACGVLDLEGDGDLDLVIQNLERDAVLLVNQGAPRGHWLQIRLRATRGHPDAIGARVEVTAAGRTQHREVRGTAGYLSGQSLMLHFGLADASRVEAVTVRWPSGSEETYEGVPIDVRATLEEGRGVVDPPLP